VRRLAGCCGLGRLGHIALPVAGAGGGDRAAGLVELPGGRNSAEACQRLKASASTRSRADWPTTSSRFWTGIVSVATGSQGESLSVPCTALFDRGQLLADIFLDVQRELDWCAGQPGGEVLREAAGVVRRGCRGRALAVLLRGLRRNRTGPAPPYRTPRGSSTTPAPGWPTGGWPASGCRQCAWSPRDRPRPAVAAVPPAAGRRRSGRPRRTGRRCGRGRPDSWSSAGRARPRRVARSSGRRPAGRGRCRSGRCRWRWTAGP